MSDNLIYLDSYTLQKDLRIRLPKSVLTNMNIESGKAKLDIFFDKENNYIVLKSKCSEGGSFEES